MTASILSVSQSASQPVCQHGTCDYLFRRLMKANWCVFALISAVASVFACHLAVIERKHTYLYIRAYIIVYIQYISVYLYLNGQIHCNCQLNIHFRIH